MRYMRHLIGAFLQQLAVLIGLGWLVVGVAMLVMSEHPKASLSGSAVSSVTGKPIPKAFVRLRLVKSLDGKGCRAFFTRCNEHGEFSFRSIPAGVYEIEAHTLAHSLSPTQLELKEGAEEKVTLELSPREPWIHFILPQRTFIWAEPVRIKVTGFVLEDKMTLRLCEIDAQSLLASGRREMLEQITAPWESRGCDATLREFLNRYSGGVLISDVPITGRDSEGIFTQYVDVPVKHSGIYLVELSAGKVEAFTSIIVTNIGALVKWGGGRALVYVCDLRSGAPLPGARVFGAGGANMGLKLLGVTGKDGVALIDANKLTDESEATLFVNFDGQLCVVGFYGSMSLSHKYKVHIYTDRPVYRPGDVVYFKGIVRLQSANGYIVPKATNVELEFRDPRGHRIWSDAARTNSFGTFHGSLALPQEIATGDATIAAAIDGEQHECTVKIASYRKPEFTVKVKAERKEYLPNEVAHVDIEAQYYFGVPVRGAKVQYVVHQVEMPECEMVEGDSADEGWCEWEEGYGSEVASGETVTDGNGRARISFKMLYPRELAHVAISGAGEKVQVVKPVTYRHLVRISVTDIGQREVVQEISLNLHPASLRLSIEPQSHLVSPNEPVRVSFKVTDLSGKPVSRARIEAAFGEVVWESDEKGNWSSYLKPVKSITLTTSQFGTATCSVKPTSEGEWCVYAIVEDEMGWRNADSEYIYACGGVLSLPAGRMESEIELVPAKDSFAVGESARVLLRSGKRDAHVLVTVEAERVYRHWVVRLDGKPKLIEFDVQCNYIPGVWICAALVESKKLSEAKAFIGVSRAAKELKVSLHPSKRQCAPGESIEWTIKVTDESGEPVRAELSLSVVDEAIYAIKDEPLDELVRAFYGRKQHEVMTICSFPELYMQANKASIASIRKHFPDTAFWAPSLYTDENGTARVNVKMPDAITTWRATVKAVTVDTSLGAALSRVIVNKPLMVRLQLPRFLVEGDEVSIVGLVHNESDQRKDLTVRLSCDGLNVDGGNECHVVVRPHGVAKLTWKAKATKHGCAKITLSAVSNDGCSDAVQRQLQVLPLAVPYTFTKSGRLNAGETKRLSLFIPSDVVRDVGELKILLSPSPAGSILSALEFLVHYPYGCVEQTMSGFMPDVLAHRAWNELGWAFPERLKRDLPRMVGHGLVRLYKYQHEDGSWGWCYYDDADLWMTAYVAYGLLECRRSGFEVDPSVLEGAASWLKEHLPSALRNHSDDYAYALACYALAMLGERKFAVPSPQWLKGATPKARALIAMAAINLGDSVTFNAAIRQLVNDANEGAEECTWGTVEDTAWALRALLCAEDRVDVSERQRLHELADKTANHLLSIRTGECWESTRQTAVAVAALLDYLKKRRWALPRGNLTATLNGGRHSIKVEPTQVCQRDLILRINIEEVIKGGGALTLQFDGSGTVYYSAMLNCLKRISTQTRYIASSCITVTRHYKLVTYGEGGREYLSEFAGRLKCHQGSILRCTLTVSSSKPLKYLLIEEPIPAGCEVIESGELERSEWDWWYAERDVRDERVVFFVREMPPGKRQLSYMLRVECNGNFTILPTTVSAMYEPAIISRGSPHTLTVK